MHIYAPLYICESLLQKEAMSHGAARKFITGRSNECCSGESLLQKEAVSAARMFTEIKALSYSRTFITERSNECCGQHSLQKEAMSAA